jgi:hypothetical protein
MEQGLACFVTQRMLGHKSAWPAASQRQQVEPALWNAPVAAASRRLVRCIDGEGTDADAGVPESEYGEKARGHGWPARQRPPGQVAA